MCDGLIHHLLAKEAVKKTEDSPGVGQMELVQRETRAKGKEH